MLLRLLSGMSFSHFGELWPRVGSPETYAQIAPGKKIAPGWEKIQIAPYRKNRTWEKNFAARLGGQSELGALWWDMRVACKRTCLFVCLFVFTQKKLRNGFA